MPSCWPQGSFCWHWDRSSASPGWYWQHLRKTQLSFSKMLLQQQRELHMTLAHTMWVALWWQKGRLSINGYRCAVAGLQPSCLGLYCLSMAGWGLPLGQQFTWMTEKGNNRCTRDTHMRATFLLWRRCCFMWLKLRTKEQSVWIKISGLNLFKQQLLKSLQITKHSTKNTF